MFAAREQPLKADNIVGHVARAQVTFALTSEAGHLRPESIRNYPASPQLTITDALTKFVRDNGLGPEPKGCAIAVAGVVRGDTVSITNSSWFVTKTGLEAILRAPPILLNDFGAKAWALNAGRGITIAPLSYSTAPSPQQPGVYCLIGVGMELGVAALVRSHSGRITVIESEAGASILPRLPELSLPHESALAGLGKRLIADSLLTGSGLVRLAALLRGETRSPVPQGLGEVRSVALSRDPVDREAVRLFTQSLWEFVANLVLIYGAWDGVFLAGPLVEMLRDGLGTAATKDFPLTGPHSRRLRDVHLGFAAFEHGELDGATVALRSG